MPNWQPIPEFKRILARWRPLVRSGVHLAIFVLVCGIALYKNLPRAKAVKIDATCAQLTVPAAFTANLSSAYALLESVRLWGSEGAISGLKSIQFSRNKKSVSIRQTDSISLHLSPTAVTLPYLWIQPEEPFGPIVLNLAKGVTLRPGDHPEETPNLLVSSSRAGDMSISLQSERMHIEEARYVLPSPLEPTGTSDIVKFEGIAAGAFVETKLMSASWAMQPSSMELHFRRTDREASLLKGSVPPEISFNGGQLILHGSVNPTVLVDGKKPEREISNTELDLVLDLGKFNITDISLSRTQQRLTILKLRGEGQATSIKQGGRQLMPTWVDEVVSEPYTDRGARLILLGLLALFLFKQASRALDVALKIIIPD